MESPTTIALKLQESRSDDLPIEIYPLDAFGAIVIIRIDQARFRAEIEILRDQLAVQTGLTIHETSHGGNRAARWRRCWWRCRHVYAEMSIKRETRRDPKSEGGAGRGGAAEMLNLAKEGVQKSPHCLACFGAIIVIPL